MSKEKADIFNNYIAEFNDPNERYLDPADCSLTDIKNDIRISIMGSDGKEPTDIQIKSDAFLHTFTIERQQELKKKFISNEYQRKYFFRRLGVIIQDAEKVIFIKRQPLPNDNPIFS